MRAWFRLIVGATVLTVAMSGPAAAAPAGSANHRSVQNPASGWSPWTPYVNEPFSFRDCGTTVRVTFPINKEVQRTRTDSGGNTIIEVKGPTTIRYTPKAQRLHTVNRDVSGPSLGAWHQIAFTNGDYLFAATGNQWTVFEFRSELRGTGLPLAFVSRGPFRILFKADRHGTLNQPADIITRPPDVADICRLMR